MRSPAALLAISVQMHFQLTHMPGEQDHSQCRAHRQKIRFFAPLLVALGALGRLLPRTALAGLASFEFLGLFGVLALGGSGPGLREGCAKDPVVQRRKVGAVVVLALAWDGNACIGRGHQRRQDLHSVDGGWQRRKAGRN